MESMSYLIQGAGLGALKHNTVLCGWPHDWRRKNTASLLVHTLAVTNASGLAVMMPKLCDASTTENFDGCVVLNPVAGSAMGVLTANSVSIPVPITKHSQMETIDIWWILHDGGMLILIAFLLKQGKMWNKCNLRIFCVAESDDNSIQMEQDLALFLRLLRIEAHVKVVEMVSGRGSLFDEYFVCGTLMGLFEFLVKRITQAAVVDMVDALLVDGVTAFS